MNNTELRDSFRKLARMATYRSDLEQWIGRTNYRATKKLLKNGPTMTITDEVAAWKNLARNIIAYQKKHQKPFCDTGTKYYTQIRFLMGDSFKVNHNGVTFDIPNSLIEKVDNVDYSVNIVLKKDLKIENITKIRGKIISKNVSTIPANTPLRMIGTLV